MNNSVKITPTKEGNLVTPYSGNTEYGYLMLSQIKSVFANGWLRETTNRTIIKGTVASLEAFVSANSDLELPGNLVVKEFVDGHVPDAIASAHFDESLSHEEQIAGYIKRAGNDGLELLVDDKRILRFTMWDISGKDADLTIQHTNVEAVKAQAKVQAEEAEL